MMRILLSPDDWLAHHPTLCLAAMALLILTCSAPPGG